jgi:hypothetical protein
MNTTTIDPATHGSSPTRPARTSGPANGSSPARPAHGAGPARPAHETGVASQSDSAPQADRTPDYAIYKPNSRGSGGVIRFGLNKAKGAMFVDAANQSGEKQFDWDSKFTMKWGLSDLGPVLATLQGRQSQVKLFHQSEKANSAFELSLRDDPERAPYMMSISRQDAMDKSLRKVSIPISHGEAAVLESALRAAIGRLLRW